MASSKHLHIKTRTKAKAIFSYSPDDQYVTGVDTHIHKNTLTCSALDQTQIQGHLRILVT